MIVGPGVLIEAELADVVLEALVARVRRERTVDPTVLRLVDELQQVAATVTASGRNLDAPARYAGTSEAAKVLGRSARTMRRKAKAGEVPAKRGRRNEWLVQVG